MTLAQYAYDTSLGIGAGWLFWPLFGALIGLVAAQRKGFNVAAGVIGGLLLGPLAFLMFFVSGVASSREGVRCTYCAEWILPQAIVCKHCGRDLRTACSSCGHENPARSRFCAACGAPQA